LKGIKAVAFFLAVSTAVNVSAQKKPVFKTDQATGVQYCIIKHKKDAPKPAENNYAHIIMVWTGKTVKGDADSIYLDSRKRGGDSTGSIVIKLAKTFKGCLEQGVLLMSKGDSASFRINADSLYMKTFHMTPDRVPHFITGSTYFTFNVKLVSFATEDEMKAEKQAAVQKRAEQAKAMKAQEPIIINDYLKKNNYNVQPDADGIYYLKTTPGSGKSVKDGDSIGVRYVGKFLNGKGFDSSSGHGPGNEIFKLKFSQTMPLIKGWISVLGKMQEGEKVTILIPSAMGYGERGGGPISPNTPLLFNMELVYVKSNQ
jgi:FKBP-type peptidyl-prolyl cis-trans isomerase FkpA